MITVSKIELINLETARKNRSQRINHLSVQTYEIADERGRERTGRFGSPLECVNGVW